MGLNIGFWLLLALLSLGALVMTIISLMKVYRLRNIHLSWKAGNLWGYPLFSTLFLGSMIIILAVTIYQYGTEQIIAAGTYCLLGCCWFTSSLLSSKRFITDHGIIKNINDPSQTIAWHQVKDFVEKEKNSNITYIFIYAPEGQHPGNLIRLELQVPKMKHEAFKKLISNKLGRRIRCYEDSDINVEQFQ